MLIADVSRRAKFRVDLFTFRTTPNRYTVFTPAAFYGRYLLQDSVPASLEKSSTYAGDWPKSAARWRAAYEVLYRNAAAPSDVKALARIVGFRGPTTRGDNFDIYITNYGAVLGRGPKGPMPVVATPKKPPAKSKSKSKSRVRSRRPSAVSAFAVPGP